MKLKIRDLLVRFLILLLRAVVRENSRLRNHDSKLYHPKGVLVVEMPEYLSAEAHERMKRSLDPLIIDGTVKHVVILDGGAKLTLI